MRRASTASKIDTHVSFPLHSVNMLPHTSAALAHERARTPAEPAAEHLYDLFGAVVHRGGMRNGHYPAFVRHATDWFQCDDGCVVAASEAEVRACSAYLLFYVSKRVGEF